MKQIRSLRFREKIFLTIFVIALIGFGLFVGSLRQVAHLDNEVMAAVSNPSPASPGYMMSVLPIPGSFTTGTVTNKVRFKMPWPATLVGASAIVKTTGSASTMTINVKEAGTTVLSAPITVNDTTVTEGTITDSSIADEAMISIDTAVSGAGTFVDPTVQLNFKRK